MHYTTRRNYSAMLGNDCIYSLPLRVKGILIVYLSVQYTTCTMIVRVYILHVCYTKYCHLYCCTYMYIKYKLFFFKSFFL